VRNFTPDLARALSGPSWLAERRASAVERLATLRFPSAEEEIWRYSRIAELDLDAFTPTTVSATTLSAVAAKGLHAGSAADGDSALLGIGLDGAADLFSALNDAFTVDPVVVRVDAGRAVTEPIVVDHFLAADGEAVFPRLVIEAGEDSEVTVLERFRSADVHALVCPVVEVRAHPAARVRYLAVNELGPRVWQIASQVAMGDRDSSLLMSSVALGGDYARVRTDVRLIGQGASARQIAVYFGEGTQMHDFRTLQGHDAPKTTSDLLFKGAVEDHSRSVYTGLIRIGKNAKGAAAFQTNRNIKLSEGAWAESVPNLDIENNDVKCSHASTVGPIDEDQRFYLESRGVPPQIAERLIVLGFFDEVIAQLPVPAVADEIRAQVAAKLDRRTA
jgi:Fe-S cluster assembly protein SufD